MSECILKGVGNDTGSYERCARQLVALLLLIQSILPSSAQGNLKLLNWENFYKMIYFMIFLSNGCYSELILSTY